MHAQVQRSNSGRTLLGYLSGFSLLNIIFCSVCSLGMVFLIQGPELLTILMIPAPEGIFDTGTTSPPDGPGWGRQYGAARTAQDVLAFYEKVLPQRGWTVERQRSNAFDYCLKVQSSWFTTAYIEINNSMRFNKPINESFIVIKTDLNSTSCEAP